MKLIKKLVLTMLVALVGIGIADAQFRFGIKAGLNVNSLHLKNPRAIFDKDNGTGWTAGVMTEFKVPIVGLAADLSLMYTRMNADLNVKTAPGLEAEVNNHNFIQIPINIKYKFSLPVVGSYLAPYIFTGPDFAFKLDKNTISDFKTRTCQVAWNVGLGLEFFSKLQIGASYGFGINNIAEKYDFNTVENIKNNYWTVTAAYLF